MRRGLYLGLLAILTGCPSVDVDPGETEGNLPVLAGPTVEFDPAGLIIPFPNNLLFNPVTGLLTIPEGACESPGETAIRQGVLNALDGFGAFQVAATATFTEDPDPASFNGQVRLFKIAESGAPVTPAEVPVAVIPTGGDIRLDPTTCDPASATVAPQLAFVPLLPLEERATYGIGIYAGVTTATGEAFIPSFTWATIRQEENPVEFDAAGQIIKNETPLDPLELEQLEQLEGIDDLWEAHAPVLQALDAAVGAPREDVLLAWSFNVQTLTSPLDPSTAASPAAALDPGPILGSTSISFDTSGMTPVPIPAPAFMQGALAAAAGVSPVSPEADAICAAANCAAVGDVLRGAVTLTQYTLSNANPLIGGDPIPGAWNNPRNPSLQGAIGDEVLNVQTFMPCTTPAGMGCTSPYADNMVPPAGMPVVVFAAGIGRDWRDVFPIAGSLNAAGYAVVTFDWVLHGSRAVQTTDDAAIGCSGTPDFVQSGQCFAPLLSADLAATRDGLRQSALDGVGIIQAVAECDPSAACAGGLAFDPARIGFLGHSLGGYIGTMTVASSQTLKVGAINVAGSGWIDSIENTETPALRCPVIDALIAQGIIADPTAQPWDPIGMTGFCLDPAWPQDPGWRGFAAVGRWVLDPGDPANYLSKISVPFLHQVVNMDDTVPNVGSDNTGLILGLSPMVGDENTGVATPSASITTDPMDSKWVIYSDIDADMGLGTPGNTYVHASLLRPAAARFDPPGFDGALGLAQMQTDLITWLLQNL